MNLNINFEKIILPDNLKEIILEEGIWESDEFDPFHISATLIDEEETRSDELYSFQFNPSESGFYELNKKIEIQGFDANGYGWQEFLFQQIELIDEKIASKIDADCESETCTIVTLSKDDFYKLLGCLSKIFKELKKQ